MVVDWYAHIKRCIDNTELIYGFHAGSVEKNYQRRLMAKLFKTEGKSNAWIANWFCLAGYEIDELGVEMLLFEGYGKVHLPKKHKFNVYITMNEINYIKALNFPGDVKKFLLAMVAYGKMMSIRTKKPDCKRKVRAYLYYIATHKDDYNKGAHRREYFEKYILQMTKQKIFASCDGSTTIKQYTGNRGGKKVVIPHIIIKADWIEWNATEGYLIQDLDRDVKLLCDQAIPRDGKICEKCGKFFFINSKSKKSVCDRCYAQIVKEKKSARNAAAYQKKKEKLKNLSKNAQNR